MVQPTDRWTDTTSQRTVTHDEKQLLQKRYVSNIVLEDIFWDKLNYGQFGWF